MAMRALAPVIGLLLSALSIALLVASVVEVFRGNEEMGMYFLLAAIALTAMSWLASRSVRTTKEVPVLRSFRVLTEISCASCGFKEVREFEEGDYIFKEIGKCPRCGGIRVITRICREETRPNP